MRDCSVSLPPFDKSNTAMRIKTRTVKEAIARTASSGRWVEAQTSAPVTTRNRNVKAHTYLRSRETGVGRSRKRERQPLRCPCRIEALFWPLPIRVAHIACQASWRTSAPCCGSKGHGQEGLILDAGGVVTFCCNLSARKPAFRGRGQSEADKLGASRIPCVYKPKKRVAGSCRSGITPVGKWLKAVTNQLLCRLSSGFLPCHKAFLRRSEIARSYSSSGTGTKSSGV